RPSVQREPVRRARALTSPDLEQLEALGVDDVATGAPPERLDPPRADRQVHAGQLQGPAESEQVAHRRDGESRLGGKERDARAVRGPPVGQAVALRLPNGDAEP